MTNFLYVSLAYKAAVVQLMLGEANYFSQKLELPTPLPIRVENLVESRVDPPRYGFGGMISTTNFFFGFHQPGKIWSVLKLDEDGMAHVSSDLFVELATKKPKSLIDEQGAYKIAKKCLTAISIDVPKLESNCPPHSTQMGCTLQGTVKRIMIPLYVVQWGDTNYPAVRVWVQGDTKEMLQLDINDISYSTRPPLVISNAAELNNGPPPPRVKMQTNKKIYAPTPVDMYDSFYLTRPPLVVTNAAGLNNGPPHAQMLHTNK